MSMLASLVTGYLFTLGWGHKSLLPQFLLAFGIEGALHHAQNCGPHKAHGSNERNPVMHRHYRKVHDLTRHPNHPQLFHGFPELRGVFAPDPFPVSSLHSSFDAVKDWEVHERMVDSLVQKHLGGDRHSVSVSGLQWRTQSVEQLVVEPVLTEAKVQEPEGTEPCVSPPVYVFPFFNQLHNVSWFAAAWSFDGQPSRLASSEIDRLRYDSLSAP